MTISKSAIRRAQRTLGFPEDSPSGDQSIHLDRQQERQLWHLHQEARSLGLDFGFVEGEQQRLRDISFNSGTPQEQLRRISMLSQVTPLRPTVNTPGGMQLQHDNISPNTPPRNRTSRQNQTPHPPDHERQGAGLRNFRVSFCMPDEDSDDVNTSNERAFGFSTSGRSTRSHQTPSLTPKKLRFDGIVETPEKGEEEIHHLKASSSTHISDKMGEEAHSANKKPTSSQQPVQPENSSPVVSIERKSHRDDGQSIKNPESSMNNSKNTTRSGKSIQQPGATSTSLSKEKPEDIDTPIVTNQPAKPSFTGSLFTTGSGKSIAIPKKALQGDTPLKTADGKLTNILDGNSTQAANATTARFTTGGGKPINIPIATKGRKRPQAIGSLFTTGGGKPIDIPSTEAPIAAHSLFSTGSGRPVKIPKLTRLGASVIFEAGNSLFSTGSGKPIEAPKLPSNITGTVAGGSLFKTGGGKAIEIPQPVFDKPIVPKPAIQSLFTTGKGNAVNLPNAKLLQTHHSGSMISTGSGTGLKIPSYKNDAESARKRPHGLPMQGAVKSDEFKTPWKRRKTTSLQSLQKPDNSNLPTRLNPTNSSVDTNPQAKVAIPSNGISKNSNTSAPIQFGPSLFSTGTGKNVPISSTANGIEIGPDTSNNEEGMNVCETNLTEDGKHAISRVQSNGKSLQTHQAMLERTPEKFRTPRNGITGKRNTRRALKTTPFKRPRQVRKTPAKATELNSDKKILHVPVPKFQVPIMLKNGKLRCKDTEHTENESVHNGLQDYPDYKAAGGFNKCHNHVFPRGCFGNTDCIPKEIRDLLALESADVFDVSCCIKWVSRWFPSVSLKPASCIGSEAWTRLAYSLAVWKLTKLSDTNMNGSFLSAVNVVRELMRRIEKEWHKNKQPHLLRMMRRDSAPGSHAVLNLLDIERIESGRLVLVLSDGWYVARALVDDVLENRIMRGSIRIGRKLHIFGALLLSAQGQKPFFFGDGDELGENVLALGANNVRLRLNGSTERLGIQRRPLTVETFYGLREGCGACPVIRTIILRSYPLYFMESVQRDGDDEADVAKQYLFLRQEAEFDEKQKYGEKLRQAQLAAREQKTDGYVSDDEQGILPSRDVRTVKEVLVCGVSDDASCKDSRKVVRIYDPSEDLLSFIAKEGSQCLMANLRPKKNAWTAKSDGIRPLPGFDPSTALKFPREVLSISELQNGRFRSGFSFDGVFCVLHVTATREEDECRFVYLTDDTAAGLGVLALELQASDSRSLPSVFGTQATSASKYPLVAFRDIEFHAESARHDLVHARASMRSSFYSSRKLMRQKGHEDLKIAAKRTENNLDKVQLEILREAVVSFASGTRASIGAYFTSTQEV